MQEQFEFKIKKKIHHIIIFSIVVLLFIIFFLLIFEIYFFMSYIGFKYIVYSFAITFFIIVIVTTFYFPKSINLTHKVIIKNNLGRKKEIEFYDIRGYEANDIFPVVVDIKLKNGKTISFFYDKEQFDHIKFYFKNHKIEKIS